MHESYKKQQCTNHDFFKNIYLKEFCEVNKLCLKECKPSIKEVIESFIKITIKKCRIVDNCLGKKILIKGYKIIKIHYIANDKSGRVLSECFCVPFCECIPIECKHDVKMCDVTAGMEVCEIDDCTDRCILVCTLIFICVKLKKCCNHDKTKDCCHYETIYQCDCNNKSKAYYHCEIIPDCDCDNVNIDLKNDYIKEKEKLK